MRTLSCDCVNSGESKIDSPSKFISSDEPTSYELSKTPEQNMIKGTIKTENIKRDKPINFLLKFNGFFKYS
ncbi:MAG: hypothetical protein Q8897_00115 [Sweet potato little leaf phytoplasma]|uniref:Uncharacterized protein n=1 Tax='Vigna radiata' phytoplasma TaxID=1177238 RepID=A0ABT9CYL2_9MOLU|nr:MULTISPECIES: hypothetical protein [Phytoplasma]MDV3139467.1 hypothetical protein [Candidatus Phytoplasma australasiaticum]MDO7987000.1 hypothetical protein [Sweet potato little leaf phytoplasma]MDO8005305.1 hypothetical protein [Sweet potato little leaf phytoplasma]MDO8008723.1 hypothetical protein [Sweet potato little leaf phytoplasma]MDO8020277.1 hypothetical protein [Sweet potato little leaf phytoplasma]